MKRKCPPFCLYCLTCHFIWNDISDIQTGNKGALSIKVLLGKGRNITVSVKCHLMTPKCQNTALH